MISDLKVLIFPEYHKSGTIDYVAFWVWLLWFGKLFLRFIHIIASRIFFIIIIVLGEGPMISAYNSDPSSYEFICEFLEPLRISVGISVYLSSSKYVVSQSAPSVSSGKLLESHVLRPNLDLLNQKPWDVAQQSVFQQTFQKILMLTKVREPQFCSVSTGGPQEAHSRATSNLVYTCASACKCPCLPNHAALPLIV